ncbi:MAG: hypothetical protein AMXMBFR7_43930 [Planctomycetota bacterium]|jgi:hypothetical protein|nr:hypothetical protein [Planctomycetota bacterium]
MAKGQHLSQYQKGIVKRYYENKETINTQKLGELVSDLYLEENAKKAEKKWKSVETALLNAGANAARVQRIVETKDLKKLAELAGELF